MQSILNALRKDRPVQPLLLLEREGVLARECPQLARLRSILAGPDPHHREGDTLTHTLMVLEEAARLSSSLEVRVGALFHDIGKGLTDPALHPRHPGHERLGEEEADRLSLPYDLRNVVRFASLAHTQLHRYVELGREARFTLIEQAKQNPLGVEGIYLVAVADSLGRVSPHRGEVEGPEAFLADARRIEKIRNRSDRRRAFDLGLDGR